MSKGDSLRTRALIIAYDPHDFRKVANPVGTKSTLMHLLKGAIGTGILAMPFAFTSLGWVFGMLMTAFVTALCTYSLLMYITAAYQLCKLNTLPYLQYGDAFKVCMQTGPRPLQCFGKVAAPLVNTLLVLYQLGICSVYIAYIGNNISEFIGKNTVDSRLLYLGVLLPIALMISLRDLKALVPFTTAANCVMLIGFGIVIYYCAEGMGSVTISDRAMFRSPIGLPHFMSLCLFALESVGVIVSVEAEMRHPKAFGGPCGVFVISMVIVGFFYGGLGLLGFLRYGDDVKDVVTSNTDKDLVPAIVCRVFFMISVFISYGLQGYCVIVILWKEWLALKVEGNSKACLYEYLFRYCLVLVSGLMAIAIPKVGLLISIFGSLCLSVLGFIVPSIMDMVMRYPDAYGFGHHRLVSDVFILIFGLFVLIAGLGMNVKDIIEEYRK